jgi:peptide/nickel transport system ATP-binding protein
VVQHIATHVAVMYLGRVVETAATETLFKQPRHPYTQALLASVLTPETGLGIPDMGLGLSFPDPLHPPTGCPFHPRCQQRLASCDSLRPPLAALADDSSAQVACHLYAPTSKEGILS